MTMRRLLLFAAFSAFAACRGAVPERNAPPEQSISAILIGCKTILPSGETRNGHITVNFESEGGRQAEVYRLPLTSGENYLYLVEPGIYRFAPTRSVFGFYKPTMAVYIEGRKYVLPFPRELLRQQAYDVRPGKIVSLGILKAVVSPALPGRRPAIRVHLDDRPQARRDVVQVAIRDMMDPRKSAEVRESSLAWSRALQINLMDLLAEEDPRQLYKSDQ